MPKFSVEDTERLFDFLVANREKEELVSARLAILKQLYIEMRTSPVLLDHLRSIGSFQVNINKALVCVIIDMCDNQLIDALEGCVLVDGIALWANTSRCNQAIGPSCI